MTIRYILRRTKQNKPLTAATVVAIIFIAVLFVLSFAVPQFVGATIDGYNKQFVGDADLVVSTSVERQDRFFSLIDLRADSTLKDNSVYINGYFKTIVRFKNLDGLCSLFAADFDELMGYNPVKAADLPQYLASDEIIINKNFAAAQNLKVNDRITLLFGSREVNFFVVCVAENAGLLFSGSAVLISSSAMKKLGLASAIVTNVLIKAKEGKTEVVKQALASDFSRLDFSDANDTEKITERTREVSSQLYFVASIMAVFCVLALAVLLRLAFAKDRQNFDMLKSLGLTRSGIVLIKFLTGILLCLVAFVVAIPLTMLVILGICSASVLLGGTTVGALPYVMGLGATLAVVLIATLLGGKEKKQGKTKFRSKNLIFVFPASLVCAALVFVFESVLVKAVFAACAILGIVFSVPAVILLLTSLLYKKKPATHSLRLKATAHKKDFRRFVSFLTVAVLVVSVVNMATTGLKENISQDYPFDIIVTEVRSPDEALFSRVSNTSGVDVAVKSTILFDTRAETEQKALFCNILGLSQEGFGYFDAEFLPTQEFGGFGAVVGEIFAEVNFLKTGDWIEVPYGKEKIRFFVSDTVDSGYMGGEFILVDLAAFATQAREYSDILVRSKVDTKQTIEEVGSVAGGAAVVPLSDLANFLYNQAADFLWLANLFCVVLILLAAMTTIFMAAIRHIGNMDETKRLLPLGLTKSADTRHAIFTATVGYLPIFVLLPLLGWLVSKLSRGVFSVLMSTYTVAFLPQTAVLCAVISYIFIIVTETTIARNTFKKAEGGKMHPAV